MNNTANQISCLLYLGIYIALILNMKNDPKNDLQYQDRLSLSLIGAFGGIIAAVGIFAGSQLPYILKIFLAKHKILLSAGSVCLLFAFLCPVFAIMLDPEDYPKQTEEKQKFLAKKRKRLYNRIGIILFISAATIFALLIITKWG